MKFKKQKENSDHYSLKVLLTDTELARCRHNEKVSFPHRSPLFCVQLLFPNVDLIDPRPTTRCKGNSSTRGLLYQLCLRSPMPATARAWLPLFLGELDWSIHTGILGELVSD